jgi:ParB family chromosome partitioning protein
LSEADRIAVETNLDIAALGWVPTIDNYLGRVPKARILQAVEQGCGPEAATRIGHLKKGDMAAEAQALLRTSGWLPEPLRSPKPTTEPEPPTGTENDIDGLSQHEGEPDLTAEDAELAQAAE